MTRFVYLENAYVNVDTIDRMQRINQKEVRVSFKNGRSYVCTTTECNPEEIAGKDHIVQLIKCNEAIEAHYHDNEVEGGIWTSNIPYLALCADGTIRGLAYWDGELDFVDDVETFIGIFEKK